MNRKLYRNMRDKMVAGVCSGLADYLQTDATIVRLVFLLAFFGAGVGPIAYLILWVVLPVQYGTPVSNPAFSAAEPEAAGPPPMPENQETASRKVKPNLIMGIILIAMGSLFLIDNLVSFEFFSTYWPILLIVAGLALLFSNMNKRHEQE